MERPLVRAVGHEINLADGAVTLTLVVELTCYH